MLLSLNFCDCRFANTYFCGLQHMKPGACKLWPFKVLSEPKYGQANQALFNYDGRRLFIYADAMCSGLRYGSPTWEFTFATLKEFVELALGTRQTQCKTTSNCLLSRSINRNGSGSRKARNAYQPAMYIE